MTFQQELKPKDWFIIREQVLERDEYTWGVNVYAMNAGIILI